MSVVMDFPTAWAFIKDTKPEDHDEKCSWRTGQGAFLCDCHVLWNEYDRRKEKLLDDKRITPSFK